MIMRLIDNKGLF